MSFINLRGMEFTELGISNWLFFLLQKINLVAVQQYATQVNTIAESCSMRNHFDICRPKTRQDRTGIFTGLLRFIRKQLHNCGMFHGS